MFRSIPLFGSTAWWAFYAERERGFTSSQVALYIICAYGLGCVGYYICGRSMERFGRRPTALVYGVGGIAFSILLFQTTSKEVAFVSLLLAVFSPSAWSGHERLRHRAVPHRDPRQAAAWIRNVFEIAGYVFGPAIVGILGDHQSGAIGRGGHGHGPDAPPSAGPLVGVALHARDQGPRARGDQRVTATTATAPSSVDASCVVLRKGLSAWRSSSC